MKKKDLIKALEAFNDEEEIGCWKCYERNKTGCTFDAESSFHYEFDSIANISKAIKDKLIDKHQEEINKCQIEIDESRLAILEADAKLAKKETIKWRGIKNKHEARTTNYTNVMNRAKARIKSINASSDKDIVKNNSYVYVDIK